MYKNLLVNACCGTGAQAALCQVLKEAKQFYQKIYVISPYSDLFRASPYVDYVYEPQDGSAAFEDLDIDDTYIADGRIYSMDEFIHKKINYSEAYRKYLNIPTKGEELSTTKMELKPHKQFESIAKQREDFLFHNKDTKDKKYKNFILFQSTGGKSPLDASNVPYDNRQQPLRRYMSPELVQDFIDLFRKAHPETAIVAYQLPGEPRYNNTEQFVVPYMTYAYLAQSPKCKGIVGIDSSLPHITAGLNKAVVLWYHTLPDSFGYRNNVNIIQNCNRDNIRYFSLLGRASNRVDEIKPEVLMKIVEDNIYGEFKPGIIETNVEGEIVE